MRVVVDSSEPMSKLGEVAVWSFELGAWGECAQAPTEVEALTRFARRVRIASNELVVEERISGSEAIFHWDELPVEDSQISRTLDVLDDQRAITTSLFNACSADELDTCDAGVEQPAWMTWRTPRQILHHIADTEARAYPRWCGLPELDQIDDIGRELTQSAAHVRELITTMPRTFRTEHRSEIWTPVKLLRRLAWHERIELVFLRRRLRNVHAPERLM